MQYQKQANTKKFVFAHSIKMPDLSPNESKLIERFRSIKGYESMSEDELLSALISSKPVKKMKRILTQNQKQIFLNQE